MQMKSCGFAVDNVRMITSIIIRDPNYLNLGPNEGLLVRKVWA